jgi:hypothetical protein
MLLERKRQRSLSCSLHTLRVLTKGVFEGTVRVYEKRQAANEEKQIAIHDRCA